MALLTDDFLLELITHAREGFARCGFYELSSSELASLWECEGRREGRLQRIRHFANACGGRLESDWEQGAARLVPGESEAQASAPLLGLTRPARRATTRNW